MALTVQNITNTILPHIGSSDDTERGKLHENKRQAVGTIYKYAAPYI